MNEQGNWFTLQHYPQYRLLWISTMSTYIARWMETVVGTWIVLQLTDSPALVGLLGACRFVAMLLGPFCGAIADRHNRRRILLTAQVVYAVSSISVMLLFMASFLAVWHLFFYTLVAGLCYTFDYAARYAVAADIVEGRHLVSAMSLLALAMWGSSIFGPLVGGSLLESIRPSGCFALVTGCLGLSYLMLYAMKTEQPARPKDPGTIWKNLLAGLGYVKSDKILFSLILIAAMINLFVFPSWFTLMPILARDFLHTAAEGYGQLMAAIGFGAAMGSLLAGALPHSVDKGKLLLAATIGWPGFLMLFLTSRLFSVSVVLLIIAGMNQGIVVTLIHSLMLMRASSDMRGRVVGTRAFAIATLPPGNLITGAGAVLLGAPMMLAVNSTLAILLTVLIGAWAAELLKWRETPAPGSKKAV